MIDELVKVAEALEGSGVPLYHWHPSLATIPSADNKPCIRIWLSADGHIKDVERLPEGLDKELWKYEPNLGFALPGFNYSPKNLTKIFGKVRDSLEDLCKDGLKPNETLSRYLSTVKAIDPEKFQEEFAEKVRSSFDEKTATEFLKAKPSVFLDISDYCKYPVSSRETMQRLNELLWLSSVPEQTQDSDAYNSEEKGLEDLYPQVTLPFLGGVKLRSQVKAIPAQMRYDRCESITFPTGLETRKRAKAALEWLAPRTGERDGETYGKADEKELLFAYPKALPKSSIPITKMLGAQTNEILQQERFEKLAKTVIEQLEGLGQAAADAELEIFSLRKADATSARTKVVYYRNATVETLEAASLAWHEGCQNIPLLDVWDWSEEKNEKTGKSYPVQVDSATVFPIKLHRFLNAVWKRDGTRADAGKTKVSIFQPTDGLRLLLEKPCDALAAHMMERFMQHAQGYFLTLCRSVGKGEVAKLPNKMYYPGILGLLLFKSGKRKEAYMNESAVQLGRCLRVADELHRLYCEVVRKKELPPELCGSSLLVGMMESPGMTLNQLAMRSAPYVKWARGGSDKSVEGKKGEKINKGGLVWYWLKQWSEIAEPLLAKGWPKRLTPDERAQVFLGYLSSFPKKENPEDVETTNTSEEGGSK